jgi:hypothetical protein
MTFLISFHYLDTPSTLLQFSSFFVLAPSTFAPLSYCESALWRMLHVEYKTNTF